MHVLVTVLLLALSSLSLPARGADFEAGMAAYERRDYSAARAAFGAAAERGDADAQFMLGQLYSRGQGVLQDYVQAYKWYILATAQGQRMAAPARDVLAELMTAEQLAQAQALARDEQLPDDTTAAASKPEVETTGSATITAADGRSAALNTAKATTDTGGGGAPGGVTETEIAQIQLNLRRLGYDIGPVSGRLDDKMQAAIRAYQNEYQLTVDGQPSRALLEHLAANTIGKQQQQPAIQRGQPTPGTAPAPGATWRRLL